jgi:hypothetical protein
VALQHLGRLREIGGHWRPYLRDNRVGAFVVLLRLVWRGFEHGVRANVAACRACEAGSDREGVGASGPSMKATRIRRGAARLCDSSVAGARSPPHGAA